MTRRDHLALCAATLVTAATRIWGLARSPWDWDEILFSLALRHYDVALHHPHPPGFPLFIAIAHVFKAMSFSDFHALQAINLIAGICLVPAMVFLGRELRLPFVTSLLAALFLAFFPNVWFFGETAFSDVPSVVVVVFACALLLRGVRSDGAYVAGMIILACAGAMRPQNLLIGLAPSLIATWFRFRQRRFATIAISALLFAAILVVNFGIAAYLTGGWQRYSEAIQIHQKYITETDSFRNPNRPPLHRLLDTFFVRPYHAPIINIFVTAFALISLGVSLVRRRLPILIIVSAFSPFCLIAWLILDHFSASRFSIGYAPMIAVLAADGVTLVSFNRVRVAWAIGIALTLVMFVWTFPAVDLARRSVSPPVQAMNWIRTHVDRKTARVDSHDSMGPYSEYFLDGYHVDWTTEGPSLATLDTTPSVYVAEAVSTAPGAIHFTWPRERAWNLVRRRYFEVFVLPLTQHAQFGDGWYDAEDTGSAVWRWMRGHGSIELPPIAGRSRLRMRLFVPLNVMKSPPSVLIRANGSVVSVVRPRAAIIDFVQDFDAHAGVRTIDIETDQVVNPARQHLSGDSRDLGLRLDALEWIAVDQ